MVSEGDRRVTSPGGSRGPTLAACLTCLPGTRPPPALGLASRGAQCPPGLAGRTDVKEKVLWGNAFDRNPRVLGAQPGGRLGGGLAWAVRGSWEGRLELWWTHGRAGCRPVPALALYPCPLRSWSPRSEGSSGSLSQGLHHWQGRPWALGPGSREAVKVLTQVRPPTPLLSPV